MDDLSGRQVARREVDVRLAELGRLTDTAVERDCVRVRVSDWIAETYTNVRKERRLTVADTPVVHLVLAPRRGLQRRKDRSGRDTDDADRLRRELQSERLGESRDRSLGGGLRATRRLTMIAGDFFQEEACART